MFTDKVPDPARNGRPGWRFALALVPALLASCTAIQPNRTDFLSSYEGFEQASEIDDAIVHRAEGASLANYDRVLIKDVKVLLPESKAEGKVTDEEIARLQSTFKSTLREEFGKHFEVASRPGRGTMELRAAIVDVQPGDPLFYLIGHAPFVSYASTASGVLTGSNFGSGHATVQGELLDSRSRQRIFALIDRRSGNQLEVVGGMSRWGHVEKAMQAWCRKVAKAAAEAKTEAAGE